MIYSSLSDQCFTDRACNTFLAEDEMSQSGQFDSAQGKFPALSLQTSLTKWTKLNSGENLPLLVREIGLRGSAGISYCLTIIQVTQS